MGGPSFTPRQVIDDLSLIARTYDAQTCKVLSWTANYVSRTLTSPDPTLGRSGAVCPFVGSALLEEMITLCVLPSRSADAAMLRQAALSIKRDFVAAGRIQTRAESLRAVIILMPHVDAAEAAPVIEDVQKALKPDMVESGLMIGEFFPGCSAPGLNNPAFRPADTAVAFLAMRRMVAADLPFLIDNEAFLDSYLARFGEDGRRRLAKLRPASPTLPGAAALQAGVVAQSAMPAGIGPRPIHAG